MKQVIIIPYGRTGNNIIEHMLALYLQHCVPDLKIYCNDEQFLEMFKLHFEKEPVLSKSDINCKTITINKNGFDLNKIVTEIKTHQNIKVVVYYCLFDKLNYSKLLDPFRSIYGNKTDIKGYDRTHLVINVRLEDIVHNTNIHPNYPVIPLSFHRFLIRKTGLKPVFLGQLDNGIISTQLRLSFPNAIFIPSRGALQDFECLRRSKNLSIAISTFSFLVGYLSENTTVVHMPVYGGFNRKDRPDGDFMVKDPRYRFYEFPSIRWTASESQIKDIISDKNVEYHEMKT